VRLLHIIDWFQNLLLKKLACLLKKALSRIVWHTMVVCESKSVVLVFMEFCERNVCFVGMFSISCVVVTVVRNFDRIFHSAVNFEIFSANCSGSIFLLFI